MPKVRRPIRAILFHNAAENQIDPGEGAEAAARQEEKGVAPMGADGIRRQDPHQRPAKTKKSPAPLFHAATKRVRDDLLNTYYAFVAAFREAA